MWRTSRFVTTKTTQTLKNLAQKSQQTREYNGYRDDSLNDAYDYLSSGGPSKWEIERRKIAEQARLQEEMEYPEISAFKKGLQDQYERDVKAGRYPDLINKSKSGGKGK